MLRCFRPKGVISIIHCQKNGGFLSHGGTPKSSILMGFSLFRKPPNVPSQFRGTVFCPREERKWCRPCTKLPWEWWELESQMNPTGTQESKRFDVDYPFDMSTAEMGPTQWPQFSKHIQLSQGSNNCDFCNSVAVAKLCQLTFEIWEDFCSFNQPAGAQLGRTSI